MASKDLTMDVYPVLALSPVALEADTNGASVDLLGYESALVIVQAGIEGVTLSGTDKIAFEIEHADDDGSGAPSTFSDCVAADTIGEESAGVIKTIDAAAEAPALYSVGYIGEKRWIRIVANFSGTHTATPTPLSAVVVKGHKRHQPS